MLLLLKWHGSAPAIFQKKKSLNSIKGRRTSPSAPRLGRCLHVFVGTPERFLCFSVQAGSRPAFLTFQFFDAASSMQWTSSSYGCVVAAVYDSRSFTVKEFSLKHVQWMKLQYSRSFTVKKNILFSVSSFLRQACLEVGTQEFHSNLVRACVRVDESWVNELESCETPVSRNGTIWSNYSGAIRSDPLATLRFSHGIIGLSLAAVSIWLPAVRPWAGSRSIQRRPALRGSVSNPHETMTSISVLIFLTC